jgi:proline iminopeptidase
MKNLIYTFFGIFMILSTPLIGLNISTPQMEEITLYPEIKPYSEGYLQVSDLHKLYFCEFGNPHGIPVVVVHGGPGGGCSPSWSSFFNPELFRVVMFDQRGAGRSTPFANMVENTPQDSISDMEQLRKYLGIDQWCLFGGSWGSALSLLYSEAHPERVTAMVLRGVFLGREQDYMHLFYGMRNTYPEAWDVMVQELGEDENCDLVRSLHDKIMNPNPVVHMAAARAFMKFDTICAYLLPNQQALQGVYEDDKGTLGVARAFVHYSANNFFLEDNQILRDIDKIRAIPTIIVQGRYDVICPMKEAYDLHKQLPNSELWTIPDAGHSSLEHSVAKALKMAMDKVSETSFPIVKIIM